MDQTSSGFSCPELQKSLYMMAYLSSSRLADCDVTIERTIHRFYNSESYDSPIYSFQEVKDIITHYLDVLRNGPPSLF